ncbi:MAG: carbamoyltransferase HypF [Acidobacteriota bacterium]
MISSESVTNNDTVGTSTEGRHDHGRRLVEITGIVQGVGFRPFVYGLATRLGLSGSVCNTGGGVSIEIEGERDRLHAFRDALGTEAPPLARIDTIEVHELGRKHDQTFEIVFSKVTADATSLVSPDISLCATCRRELEDPSDHRYRYPFINCTDCGPRFTLIRDTPYDRPMTTMAAFEMCQLCADEYTDPTSRRFHAQPNACPECGPTVEWHSHTTTDPPRFATDALERTKQALAAGWIVAIKGIGGFHLACDATNETAVASLRERKRRPHKPLALMAKDVDMAMRYGRLSMTERRWLESRERPIVLLDKHPDTDLAPSVAPGQSSLGIMLPYTPLHELLLDDRPLVMTSGNRSSEPIAISNHHAIANLGEIADAFLCHDRAIQVHCDDSVVRVVQDELLLLRRSRGYAPSPIELGYTTSPTLAVGGEQKNVFCLADGHQAFLSQHIGDLEQLETLEVFDTTYRHFSKLFRIRPERLVCDLHPGYLATSWAERHATKHDLPLLRVQHHHAHLAALMTEHNLDGNQPVLGFVFDGTGYGTDDTIWGGEVLLANGHRFDRLAHLRPVMLQTGEQAIRHPGRLALSHLHAAGLDWDPRLPCVKACPENHRTALRRQLDRGLGTMRSSSMGRLFDAVAGLLGVRQQATYEGQAAIELETLAWSGATFTSRRYAFAIDDGAPIVIDPTPVLAAIVDEIHHGIEPASIAAAFHQAVADAIVTVATRLQPRLGVVPVGLSGGVFQNRLLLELTHQGLTTAGFDVLVHRLVPPNDGGLALGQLAIAAWTP